MCLPLITLTYIDFAGNLKYPIETLCKYRKQHASLMSSSSILEALPKKEPKK